MGQGPHTMGVGEESLSLLSNKIKILISNKRFEFCSDSADIPWRAPWGLHEEEIAQAQQLASISSILISAENIYI
jgi:hypothetical protein